MNSWGTWIYQDRSTDLAKKLAPVDGLGVLLVGLVVAIDGSARKRIRNRTSAERTGALLGDSACVESRKPFRRYRLLTEAEFTQKILRRKALLRLPRGHEASHIILWAIRATGRGIIRQSCSIEERGGKRQSRDDPATPADYPDPSITSDACS